MANSQLIQHPGTESPGALQSACPAVYPVAQATQSVRSTGAVLAVHAGQPTQAIRPIGFRPSAVNPKPASFLKPVWNLQSDSTGKRLFIWQTDLTAFAPRHRWEEP